MTKNWQTVVELKSFQKEVKDLLTTKEIKELIDHLALNPKDGDLIEGTGGIRKLRWRRTGTGKSGGIRVIYFYYNDSYPMFLLDCYAKNEKDNLTKAEQKEFRKLTEELIKIYSRRK